MVSVVGLMAAPVAFAEEADGLPGRFGVPLTAAAAGSQPEPVSFAISGMKYLEGRPLAAGEFSFRLAGAGVASIPAGSNLPRQLRSATLSEAEKYELVAHGDLTYYPESDQPMPTSALAQNNAEGAVTFGSLAFDSALLGKTATERSAGRVFCYTVAEQVPRNPDGSLKDGVTRDERGRYVYQGVTYDDSVKRIYLYVYQTADAGGSPVLAVLPLGDAAFDGRPAKPTSGAGQGFLNVFNGAVLDRFDGAVLLDGEAISAGEFTFSVREVAEDGTIIDSGTVPCAAAANGSEGAGVRLIDGAVFDGPGRFFYAVKQTGATRSAPADVVLDESSYIITVEVAEGSNGALDASVTYVRKKPANSDRWLDVDLDAQPSPVVWENHLKASDVPGTDVPADPDEGSAGDRPGQSGAEEPSPGGDGDTGTDGDGPHGDHPGAGASGATGNVGGSSDQSGGAATDGTGEESSGTADASPGAGQSVESGAASSSRGRASSGVGAPARGAAPAAFAQTGDDLGVPMVIACVVVVASGAALALLSRRRPPRS